MQEKHALNCAITYFGVNSTEKGEVILEEQMALEQS